VNSGASAAKGAILGRIRDALGARDVPAATEYQAIDRAYRQAADLGAEACVELFVERLQHYQVGVYRSPRAELAEAIAGALSARSKSRLVVPAGVPREWLPPALAAVEDAGLSHADLDAVDGVLTGCSLAIANTGTIVLRHTAAEGRRAVTLVPDYHLCVVFAGQVVQTVPEAIARLGAQALELVTTISGPSATADSEMTRIRGVHGPRTLDVIVAG
jgi:L-lactate dehydrogenase complex protein LldG